MTLSRRDDLPLRYVLNVPSGANDDEPMPLFIAMHGRGSDMNDLADLAEMIDSPPGYRFLFPNAPRPFEVYPGTTYGFTWFDGIPPTPESIAFSRKLVLDFIAKALARYPTPAGKVILAGFSQGALMSLDAGFRTAEPLAGIVAMSGALFEGELPDLEACRDTPVLIVHGTADEMINVNRARRARLVLEEHGLSPEYHEFLMGHQVTPESMEVVKRFTREAFVR
jgi:phospholipase/carboxylesterase